MLTYRTGGQHGSGLHAIGTRKHVLQFYNRKTLDVDGALHCVRGLVAVLIYAMQRVVDRRRNRDRAEAGVIQHIVMKYFWCGAAVNGERHRNHFGFLAELAKNAGVTVLNKCADGLSGIHDLEGI